MGSLGNVVGDYCWAPYCRGLGGANMMYLRAILICCSETIGRGKSTLKNFLVLFWVKNDDFFLDFLKMCSKYKFWVVYWLRTLSGSSMADFRTYITFPATMRQSIEKLKIVFFGDFLQNYDLNHIFINENYLIKLN